MAFLPWENIEYRTNLTKDEIINRINSAVEPKGIFGVYFFKNIVMENLMMEKYLKMDSK